MVVSGERIKSRRFALRKKEGAIAETLGKGGVLRIGIFLAWLKVLLPRFLELAACGRLTTSEKLASMRFFACLAVLSKVDLVFDSKSLLLNLLPLKLSDSDGFDFSVPPPTTDILEEALSIGGSDERSLA